NDVFRLHAGGEHFLECLVAAPLDVVLQTPVAAIQIRQDHGVNMATVKAHAAGEITRGIGVQALGKGKSIERAWADQCGGGSHGVSSDLRLSSSIMASIRSVCTCPHLWRSFTSITGQPPEDLMHSSSVMVDMPSSED